MKLSKPSPKRWLAVILLTFLSLSLFAQSSFVLHDNVSSISVGGAEVKYFEDTQTTLSFDEIRTGYEKGDFNTYEGRSLNFKVTANPVWLKFNVTNRSEETLWMLECSYPSIDFLTVYIKDASGQWASTALGDKVPFDKREVRYRSPIFPLELPLGSEHEIFVRVQTSGVALLPLSLVPSKTLYEEIAFNETAYGVFFGILLVMVLYNLLIFFSLRDVNYLYYPFVILSFVLYNATLRGQTFQYIFPNNIELAHQSLPFSLSFGYVFSALFAKSFLKVKSWNKRLNTALNMCIYLFIVTTLLSFVIDYGLAIRFYLIAPIVLFVPLLMTTGVLAWRKGIKAARFYIFAWVVFFSALIITPLYSFGVLPGWIVFEKITEIAHATQVILLALGLAERYKEMRIAHEKAEQETKRVLQESNEQLEQKVKKRTHEIEIQKEEIQTQNEELRQITEEVSAQRDHIKEQHKDLESAYQDLNLVGEVGWKVTSTLSFDELMETVSETMSGLFGVKTVAVGLFLEKLNLLEFSVYSGGKKEMFDQKEMQEEVWYRLALRSFEQEKELNSENEKDCEGSNATLALPLIAKGSKIGALALESRSAYQSFSKRHVTTIQAMASYIATALDNTVAYEQLNEKNVLITDSIRYAKTIQEAILPEAENLKSWFNDYFVIFKPKDIVSGDFYWFHLHEKDPNVAFLVVADCTGHGVPGAFMSMIGSRLLSEIIVEGGVHEPDRALEMLNRRVRKSLRQNDDSKGANRDGMDLSLVKLTKKEGGGMEVTFAGAKSTVYWHDRKNKKIESLKGDRKTIGGVVVAREREFCNRTILLHPGDTLYLPTDGLIDQNSPDRTKFGSVQFAETLLACGTFSATHQQQYLEEALRHHQGDSEQRDDITVFGIVM